MSVIELNDVSVTFHEGGRTVEAVKHVNISVEKGEIFGIVGFFRSWQIHFGAHHQSAGTTNRRPCGDRWQRYHRTQRQPIE